MTNIVACRCSSPQAFADDPTRCFKCGCPIPHMTSERVREQLLDDTAAIALALQFAIQHTPDGHERFQRVLALIPAEIRGT